MADGRWQKEGITKKEKSLILLVFTLLPPPNLKVSTFISDGEKIFFHEDCFLPSGVQFLIY